MKLSKKLHNKILEVPGIEFKKSRFNNSKAYFFGNREIAHFHGENEIDIRVTRREITKQKWRGGSNPLVHIRTPSSDWAEISFKNSKDFDFVLNIVKLAKGTNSPK